MSVFNCCIYWALRVLCWAWETRSIRFSISDLLMQLELLIRLIDSTSTKARRFWARLTRQVSVLVYRVYPKLWLSKLDIICTNLKNPTLMSAVFNAHVRYLLFLNNQQPLFHINTCPVMSSTLDSIATEIFLWSGDAFSRLLLIAPDVFTVTSDTCTHVLLL